MRKEIEEEKKERKEMNRGIEIETCPLLQIMLAICNQTETTTTRIKEFLQVQREERKEKRRRKIKNQKITEKREQRKEKKYRNEKKYINEIRYIYFFIFVSSIL